MHNDQCPALLSEWSGAALSTLGGGTSISYIPVARLIVEEPPEFAQELERAINALVFQV